MRVSILRSQPQTGGLNFPKALLVALPLLIFAAFAGYFGYQYYLSQQQPVITPSRITVSNYKTDAVTLSFSTPNHKTQSQILWGESTSSLENTQNDDRTNLGPDRETHYFTITDLSPGTKYYFRIKSGDSFYPVTDKDPLTFQTPSSIKDSTGATTLYGDIDTSNAQDTIIYAYVTTDNGDAYPLSTFPKTDGSWFINANLALLPNGSQAKITDTDQVQIVIDSGIDGFSQNLSANESPVSIKLTENYNFDTVFTASDFENTEPIIVTPTTISETTPTPTVSVTSETPTPTITPSTSVTITPTGIDFDSLQQNIPLTVGSATQQEQATLFNLFSTPTITNVTATSFTTFWITPAKEQTKLIYGPTGSTTTLTKQDDRDVGAPSTFFIHYTTISLLTAKTPYTFVYGNNAGTKAITTPDTISSAPSFQSISGTVQNMTGECVIQASIQGTARKSSILSVIVPSSGLWSMNIGPLRTQNYSAFFSALDTENITFELVCVPSANTIKTKTATMTVKQAIESQIVLSAN